MPTRTRQEHTISGATLHHVAIAHQKYFNWVTMVTHYMRAHNQWLHMATKDWKQHTYFPSARSLEVFWGNMIGKCGTGVNTDTPE